MRQEEILILIPKVEKYIEYVLSFLIKIPRIEKFNIGNEYKIRIGEIDSKGAKKNLCGHFGYIKYANVKNLTEEIFEI